MESWLSQLKSLPPKHRDLSLSLQEPCKKPGVMVHVCDHSTGEARSGDSMGIYGQLG